MIDEILKDSFGILKKKKTFLNVPEI